MARAELKAVATLDKSGFDAGVGGMKTQLSGLKNIVAGAFGVGAIMSFGRMMLRTADDMQTAASTFGLTMQDMIGMQAAFAESGIKADSFMRILARLPEAQNLVIERNKGMIEGLKALGISQEEFVTSSPDKLLERIAQGYTTATDKMGAHNAITEIFGLRIGPQMIEVLQRIGTDGFDKFKEGAEGAAKGMTELAKASDAIERFWNNIIIGAGKAVGAIAEVGEEIGRLTSQISLKEFLTSDFWTLKDKVMAVKKEDSDWQGSVGIQKDPTKLEPATTPAQQASLDKLKSAQAEEARKELEKRIKAQNEATRRDEARQSKEDDYNEAQDKIASDYSKSAKEFRAGKGIATPDLPAVDALQKIGGLVGGVAGRGQQQARMMERQANASEAIQKLVQETNLKLAELDRKLDGIISE
jgi:hypothetical protein